MTESLLPTSIDEMRQKKLGLPTRGMHDPVEDYSIKITEIDNSKDSIDIRNTAHFQDVSDTPDKINLKVQIQRTAADGSQHSSRPERYCFHAEKCPSETGCALDCILKYANPRQVISHWTFPDEQHQLNVKNLLKQLGERVGNSCELSLDFIRGVVTIGLHSQLSESAALASVGDQVGRVELPVQCQSCEYPRKYQLTSEKAISERDPIPFT